MIEQRLGHAPSAVCPLPRPPPLNVKVVRLQRLHHYLSSSAAYYRPHIITGRTAACLRLSFSWGGAGGGLIKRGGFSDLLSKHRDTERGKDAGIKSPSSDSDI